MVLCVIETHSTTSTGLQKMSPRAEEWPEKRNNLNRSREFDIDADIGSISTISFLVM